MTRGSSLRGTRRKAPKAAVDEIPEVFREMVAEDERRAQGSSSTNTAAERPLKRRRIAAATAASGEGARQVRPNMMGSHTDDTRNGNDKGKGKAQAASLMDTQDEIMIDAGPQAGSESEVSQFEDEDEEESDADWEDVDLSTRPINFAATSTTPPPPSGPLELVLNDPTVRKSAAPPRRTITAVDRRIRLETHKLHLICLLQHLRVRSRWCNDETIQDNLLTILPDKADALLNHDPTDQQFRRSKLFLEGLQIAVDAFRKKFKVTHQGIISARWRDPEELKNWTALANMEDSMTEENFQRASNRLSGSRDTGAQLFCAMLRGAGVTARLVCSLQVLPFGFASKHAPLLVGTSDTSTTPTSSVSTPKRPQVSLRHPRPISTSQLVQAPSTSSSSATSLNIVESPFPIYWVEAWSVAAQKWIPVDPLTTYTVGKPSKLCPPLSDSLNTLSYVIGCDDTSHLTDVTRRYSPHFTSKTRKLRVHSTKNGERWYRKLLSRFFSRGYVLDRDQVEEAELSARELAEPMPRNVQDLKGHPLFALKRHLKRDEVIFPERKVGTITVGHGKNQSAEGVYRRQDVKVVKTADQWYRLGREVIPEEEGSPLKFTAPRRRPANKGSRHRHYDDDDERDDNGEEIIPDQPMYSFTQTTLYTPPAVILGMVPKNSFGNLDLFVPTMLPSGAAHIPQPLAAQAAKILGVDAAGAVIGFQFNGRQASPVLRGVVVAEEYAEAVRKVVKGLEWEIEREREDAKKEAVLAMWRKWYMRLTVRKRLGIEGESRDEEQPEEDQETDQEMSEQGDESDEEGGFTRDSDAAETGFEGDYGGGGFFPDPDDSAGGFMPETTDHDTTTRDEGGEFFPDAEADNNGGGGFIVDDSNDGYGGGGFLPESPPSNQRLQASDSTDFNIGGGFIVTEDAHDERQPNQHQVTLPLAAVQKSDAVDLSKSPQVPRADLSKPESPHNQHTPVKGQSANDGGERMDVEVGTTDGVNSHYKSNNHQKEPLPAEPHSVKEEVQKEELDEAEEQKEEEEEEEEEEEDPEFDNPDTDWI